MSQLLPFPDLTQRMLAALLDLAAFARGGDAAEEIIATGEILPRIWDLTTIPDADLRSTAIALAKELANGPASLGAIRKLIWESLDTDWTGQLQAERKAQKIAGKSEDFIEGVSAFLQKRPAQFKGE